MTDERMGLPQGTLDLLILKKLALEPQHGGAIPERLQEVSREALQVGQGSLYPSPIDSSAAARSRRGGGRPRTTAALKHLRLDRRDAG